VEPPRVSRYAHIASHAALWIFVGSATAFGLMPAAESIGFSHRNQPLALLGAAGMSGGLMFNLLAFVLAGLLAAVALWPLRDALPNDARWSARIGTQLILLSALAFAAQGLLPIDRDDLDSLTSGLHGMVWTLWWLAFSAGNAAMVWGLRMVRKSKDHEIATFPAVAAQAVPMFALFAQAAMPVAVAQRIAFLLWFIWVIWISNQYGRSRAAA
jgi:hypothetical membrane protein